MKLLIVTQRVDKDDPVLGFFHEWVQEFSSHCEKVTVVCLGTGDYSFPPNVKVLSLGKERGASKLEYLVNFYRYVLRVDYTHVFVHMNQEYVLLAGDLWRLMGKKVALWRNHPDGSLLTNLAVALAHKVFCTSPSSYTSQFKKTKIMPAGIDVDSYEESKTDLSTQGKVLFFGRLSSVKNVHVFIEALKILDERGIVFHADIIGSPTDEIGVAYEKELHIQGTKLTERGKLAFKPAIKHSESKSLFGQYGLYVNLSPDGSLDKTMLESMASSVPVLVSNSAFKGDIPPECIVGELDPKLVADGIEAFLSQSLEKKAEIARQLREYVQSTHGLKTLISLLVKELDS